MSKTPIMLILFTFDKIVKIPQAVEVMKTNMPNGFNMSNEEKMIDIKCSVCMKCMQMPVSFLKVGKKIEVDAMHMPHICSDCIDKIGDVLGDKKMRRFMEEVNIEIPLNLVPYSLGISIYTFPLWSSIINGNVYNCLNLKNRNFYRLIGININNDWSYL